LWISTQPQQGRQQVRDCSTGLGHQPQFIETLPAQGLPAFIARSSRRGSGRRACHSGSGSRAVPDESEYVVLAFVVVLVAGAFWSGANVGQWRGRGRETSALSHLDHVSCRRRWKTFPAIPVRLILPTG